MPASAPGVSLGSGVARDTVELIGYRSNVIAWRLPMAKGTAFTPRPEVRTFRSEYAGKADAAIAASPVVAVHFRTFAAANSRWR